MSEADYHWLKVVWDGRKLTDSDPVKAITKKLLEMRDAGHVGDVFLRTAAGDVSLGEVQPKEKLPW